MEYSLNAKMMLGYIDDDDDEILNYDDGQLDLSEDNEEEDEAESVQEYNQHYPETPEEKIHWQEQIRMIHLRSHLNQLLEKVKDAQYTTDKAREELKKCRGQIRQYEGERDRLFNDIRNKESDGNQSAVYRVRAAHERICAELDAEQNLEQMLIERLDKAEYDLAISEVERGKFILAEDDLLHREHRLSKEKTDMAMVRLHKEEMMARQAMITKNKDDKTRRDAKKDAQRRHRKALEEAERSHERANKYLNKTLEKMKAREHEEEARYKNNMDKKMDMLLKLKADITSNRDNLKAIRARDKAGENKLMREETEERQRIIANGGNPEEILLVKKRQNEFAQNKQNFDQNLKGKKADIMQKILLEEENLKRRKQRQPYLWDSPTNEKKQRVGAHKKKPLKALEDYMRDNKSEEMMELDNLDDNKEREILMGEKQMPTSDILLVMDLGKPKPPVLLPIIVEEDAEGNEDIEDSEAIKVIEPAFVRKESFESFYSNSTDFRRMLKRLSAEVQGIPYVNEKKISIEEKVEKMTKKKLDKNKNMNMMTEAEVIPENYDVEVEKEPIDGNDETLESKDEGEKEDENKEVAEVEDVDEEKLDRAEEERALQDEDNDDLFLPHDQSDSSSDENEEEQVDLAKPEFEGLWNVETKPYRIPKDMDAASLKPVWGSKMDKEIMKKTLEKTREGIVIHQVAAGREFSGCPFYSKPDVIHFKDFVVGKSYKKKVLLTNVSYTVNYIKFMDITERLKDFIKIQFDPPGQMSAGLTCEMVVTFKPMINEDLNGEVMFLTQTGPFQIPLVCSTKKCDLCLDTNTVDFGTAVIGETLKRTFTLTNRGALGTKFDFFKVTGMKQRTLTTAVTSLGRLESSSSSLLVVSDKKKPPDDEAANLDESGKEKQLEEQANDVEVEATADSSRGVSPDSAEIVDKPSLAVSNKKKSEEELEKIPEAGEVSIPPPEGEVPAVTEDSDNVTEGQSTLLEPTMELSENKQDKESDEAISPDLAVSEMDDYSSLDGMRVGPLITGEIGPFSSLRLEIVWQPTIPGKVDSEFLVSFADPLSESLSIHALANAIDVPVWVERQTVDLKICMFDRLYQDTIIVNNRATTALRLKFEVCKELSNHLELLPKTGYIQAQSQFSAQLKFLPRPSLFTEASKFFDPDTGVLEAPMTIRVADQTTPVVFTVQAVVTNSDMEFDISDIDFGYCTIHESVKKTIKLTNKSILPQKYGFVGLPEYVEVQPNDGFGTLLPLETLELDVIFSPKKTKEYKLELVCRSLINKDFKISCKGIGVLTPLELSHQVIHFAATPLYDIASTTFHVVNSHTSSNEFTHPVPRIGQGDIAPVGPTSFEFKVPSNAPFSISPCVGTVKPGQKTQIQVRFSPSLNDEDVRQEALRIHNKGEAAKEEQEREEAALREKQEKEQSLSRKSSVKGRKNVGIMSSSKDINQSRRVTVVEMAESQWRPHANGNGRRSPSLTRNKNENYKVSVYKRKEKKVKINVIPTQRYYMDKERTSQTITAAQRRVESARTRWGKDNKNNNTSRREEEINFDPGVGVRSDEKEENMMIFSYDEDEEPRKTEQLDDDANNNFDDDDDNDDDDGGVDRSANGVDGVASTRQSKELLDADNNHVPDGGGGGGGTPRAGDSDNGDRGDNEENDDDEQSVSKGKAKASPKGPQAKSNKLSTAPSATSSAVTMTSSPRFDPEALTRDSPEYLAAVTSLVRQFRGHFRSFTVPCYVASGATGNPGQLSYSIHNTLYLEVHCPAVKPPIVVISDGGKRTVDFGDVSIGQTYPKSVTIQNISNEYIELRATALHPHGPFIMLNALRALDPGCTHTILLTFSPQQGQVFQEKLGIKTLNSTLHLTFKGRGVSPLVNLSVEDNLFDCNAVLVGEYIEKNFKIQNTSPLAIDYVIKQDSLSQLRHKKAQGLPSFLNKNEVVNFVGVQNDCGKNVFDIVPTKGSIQAGETKEIMVTFAPDHESDLYSDGIRLELFDQEESHFFRLIGQAKSRVMFLDGADPLLPSIESLALHHVHVDDDESGEGKGGVVSPPALVTVRSVMKDDTFQPGVREIYAGCVRTMAVSQKKNGEFTMDGIQGLLQKGFTIEPQKGMVEAGTRKPIVITWTPPQGYDPSCSIEETATLTLRCDITEQITLMIRAMVVTE